MKSVVEQAFCEFILYLPWGTVKYISSTNQNNHILNSFVRWTQWCTTHQLIMKSAYFDSSNQKRRAFALKPRDFISNHETKPWSRQKCSIATSLSIIFPSAEHSKLAGLIKSHETHGICKCVNWTTVSVSLCPLWCFSQRRRSSGNPKHKGYMKRFESESCVSLGIGIILIQDG